MGLRSVQFRQPMISLRSRQEALPPRGCGQPALQALSLWEGAQPRGDHDHHHSRSHRGSNLPQVTGARLRTFLFAPGHARPVGLLTNDQVKIRTGVGQHRQWNSLDGQVRVATQSGSRYQQQGEGSYRRGQMITTAQSEETKRRGRRRRAEQWQRIESFGTHEAVSWQRTSELRA